jgi:hypothetical protein
MGTRANVVSGVTAYGKSTPADNGGGAGIYATERFTAGNLGIGLLYSDIVEFNNELRSDKTYSDNIWINWFFNDKVATIDYIEIQEISEEE